MKSLGYYRLLSDILFVIVSFALSITISGRQPNKLDWGIVVFLMVAWYFSSKATNLYDDFRTVKFIDEFLLILPNVMVQMMVLVTSFFMLDDRMHARKVVLFFVVIATVVLAIKKYLAKKIAQFRRINGKNVRKVVIVGASDTGMSFYEMLNKTSHYGYKVVGFVDTFKPVHLNGMYKGTPEDLERVLQDTDADEVIVTLEKFDQEQLDAIIKTNDKLAVRTRIIPDYFRFNSSRFSVEMFGKFPIVTVRHEPLDYLHWRVLKRGFDIVFSLLVCLFVFSWLFPILAILIKLNSKGPVFFIQERWGRGSKPIKCFKFRSMLVDAPDMDKSGKFMQAGQDDPRITKIGRFLRKSNFDELPQFLNVIMGDMSVVGPRPHAVKHNIETMGKIDNYLVRHWVKPGITGLAQANGYRGETTDFNLMRKRVHFDIWYIENWSFWLDIKIIFMTAYNMIKGEPNAY